MHANRSLLVVWISLAAIALFMGCNTPATEIRLPGDGDMNVEGDGLDSPENETDAVEPDLPPADEDGETAEVGEKETLELEGTDADAEPESDSEAEEEIEEAACLGEACFIGGVCVGNGNDDLTNGCDYCNHAASTGAWTHHPYGWPCVSDAGFCDGAGHCILPADGDPDDDTELDAEDESDHDTEVFCAATDCRIGGACYQNGGAKPGDECQACLSAKDSADWSPRGQGTSCRVLAALGTCDGKGTCITNCADGPCCQSGLPIAIGRPCVSGQDSLSCTDDLCKRQYALRASVKERLLPH